MTSFEELLGDPHEQFDQRAELLKSIVEYADTTPMAAGGRVAAEMAQPINTEPVERYCVDSGRPVHMIPGDRCIAHGNAPTMCATSVRPARCEHPRLSPNHPYPRCSECGRDLREEAVRP